MIELIMHVRYTSSTHRCLHYHTVLACRGCTSYRELRAWLVSQVTREAEAPFYSRSMHYYMRVRTGVGVQKVAPLLYGIMIRHFAECFGVELC